MQGPKTDIAASTLGLKVVGVKSATLNEVEPVQPLPYTGMDSMYRC